MRVLEHRAPKDRLRRLGGVQRPTSLPAAEAVAAKALELTPPDLQAMRRDEPSWWDHVTAQLRQSLAGEEPSVSNAPEHHSLLELVTRLRLTGAPVQSLAVTRSKRPLRFDAEGKRLLLSPSQSAAAALLSSIKTDSGAACVLAAHAVSEVNRALVEVTDGEEQRALLSLLSEL